MTDNSNEDDQTPEEPGFAEMLAAYGGGMNEDLRVGDKIDGEIISIGRDTVFVDTGSKVDGAVDKMELLDENGELTLVVGDRLQLYVVSRDESEIRLSRTISGAGGFEMLREAFRGGVPVEGKVTATCKGGLNVEVMKQRAFCPISQIDLAYVENPEKFVGETFEFEITQLEEKAKNIVVSRKKILSREVAKERERFFQDMSIGKQYPGVVVRVMPYGAFIELARGVEGMAHISELSWSRVEKAEEVVREGDSVSVVVTGVTTEEESGRKKIALSLKQVTENPWDNAGDDIALGEKMKGKVTRCMNFGAFVEIRPGIEGLVHISEMSYTKRIVNPSDVVNPGDVVDVLVKDVDPQNRRISLSMRDAEGDPWIDIEEKFSRGQSVRGTLEKKEKFGFFISLEPGITGLLPKSRLSAAEKPDQYENLKPGAEVTVIVDEIRSSERRISLALPDQEGSGDWQQYSAADSGTGSLGSLGEKLKLAMEKKK